MNGNRYVPGNTVELVGTFEDSGGPVDPSAANLTIRFPDGTRVTYVMGDDSELVQIGVGVYVVRIVADMVGTYWYRWEGSTTKRSADERYFVVIPSAVLVGA